MDSYSTVLTVSRLVGLLREVVEENFVQVVVEGEISNFAVPASGHFYFSLKDEQAQLRAVMFRTQSRLLPFRPEDGMHVLCTGSLSVYPQRGEVQLVVEGMEPCGVGGLQVAFEQLKRKLAAEGLFAPERKRPLPSFPRTIGVVTSATGAAIHDILQVLRRRAAGVRVLLRPVRVQGEQAAGEIAAAIADLNAQGEAQVLIVGRGGGSLEDLQAFNEEVVARAIFSSRLPVISAVGHEVDVTIADLVADMRAPTPSAAAEMVMKSRLELEGHLDHLILRLAGQMESRIRLWRERVEALRRRLRSPAQIMAVGRARREQLAHRLIQGMARALHDEKSRLGHLSARLETLSPLKTLARGYSIVSVERTGEVVRDATTLDHGDRLWIRFARGSARASVEETGE